MQRDLFDDTILLEPAASPRRPIPPNHVSGLEAAARLLEASDDYKVLRRLRPRKARGPRPLGPDERICVVVDTETTGLDHGRDEVIELGMAAVIHDAEGRIKDVVGSFSALREPSVPIPEQVTALTGITAEMVQGHVLDIEAVEAFIAPAELVIAHNARFDRTFCERLAPGFARKPWACSVHEIDWRAMGHEGSKLGYLVAQIGWFHSGHRAVDDVLALVEVLGAPLPTGRGTALARLLEAAERTRVRIWAERSPFEMKDRLKEKGYRWNDGSDGSPKAWWIDVDEEAAHSELRFLRQEIYGWDADPPTRRLTAFDRHRRC